MRKNHLWFLALGLALLTAGCGQRGPTGPEGPAGHDGRDGIYTQPGVSMIKEYAGSFSSAGDFAVSVPEIQGHRTTTYVMVYWAIPGAPDIWTLMADGWKDLPSQSRTATVSWTDGEVSFWGMSADDMYLIQVFQQK